MTNRISSRAPIRQITRVRLAPGHAIQRTVQLPSSSEPRKLVRVAKGQYIGGLMLQTLVTTALGLLPPRQASRVGGVVMRLAQNRQWVHAQQYVTHQDLFSHYAKFRRR